MKPTRKISSALRWLFMVLIGCAVLETAQPANAAGPDMGTRPGGTLLVNAPDDGAAEKNAAPTKPDAGGGWRWLVVSLFFAAGAGWFYWKRRNGGFALARAERKLTIEETRSLGNRQHLVVATYEHRKFLLGVTPGQIQFIARLDGRNERKGDSWRRI
ncbi:hypothetical protein Ga0100231_006200 [Opitutaceae bacterium TAV4]|nr:hypothetical protein Ga0100231_006200 [Opitutaceae bacterium TAV4]RRK02610.1 hypothetical protein Ga0100230_005720 [Opitutaceae bacterium TAV3]